MERRSRKGGGDGEGGKGALVTTPTLLVHLLERTRPPPTREETEREGGREGERFMVSPPEEGACREA